MDFTNPHVVNQLLTMLNYQKQLNDVFDPQWRTNRHQYLRAVVVEGGEAIDHHGYKWWKKQVKNLAQMQLEVVDILHFYLSEVARLNLDNDEAVLREEWLKDEKVVRFDEQNYLISRLSTLEKFELIIGLAVSRRMSWSLFRAIQEDVELDFAALHHQYAAKNVLNLLRQRHGDKQGTYIKVWEGEEDNIHLSRQMEIWAEDETMDVLYGRLESLYKTLALKVA